MHSRNSGLCMHGKSKSISKTAGLYICGESKDKSSGLGRGQKIIWELVLLVCRCEKCAKETVGLFMHGKKQK